MNIEIDGKVLDAALGSLKLGTQRTILRRVARDALQPMAERARQLAPDDPKTPSPDLHTSIIVSNRTARFRREGNGWVNAFMGPTREGYPQAMVQEFGSAKMAPHPYMRPAFEALAADAIGRVAGGLTTLIAKAVQRAAKRAG